MDLLRIAARVASRSAGIHGDNPDDLDRYHEKERQREKDRNSDIDARNERNKPPTSKYHEAPPDMTDFIKKKNDEADAILKAGNPEEKYKKDLADAIAKAEKADKDFRNKPWWKKIF